MANRINLLRNKIFFRLLLLLFISGSSRFSWGQIDNYKPFAYYLIHKKYIVLATSTAVKKVDFCVKIDQWIKPETRKKDKLKIRYNVNFRDIEQKKNELGLQLDKQYIFLIGYKTRGINKPLLRDNSRFKVVGDSLCIGYSFLKNLPLENKDLLQSENPFNDSRMPRGYIISLTDFIQLTQEVNRCIVQIPEKKMYQFLGTDSTDPFTLAVIDEFVNNSCYSGLFLHPPVNLPDQKK